MLSWKNLILIATAAISMNGVAGVEQGYGGGIWTTAPSTDSSNDSPVPTLTPSVTTAAPTSTESSADEASGSEEYPSPINDDNSTSSDTDSGSLVDGSSATGEGSYSQPRASGDGSCDLPPMPSGSGSTTITSASGSIDFPSESGSADFPPSSETSSDSADNRGVSPSSSVDGTEKDSSTDDDSTAGEASTGGSYTLPTGGCKVRARRLRQ
ncbi:unnamed protein product [Phytophthora fragariaefolia]|uniref:Unnamed protein product n=1 Tax=Phytophthora fragariaefolia TaxID=1490495 RepID=A0A9W7D2P2_9STRA|nr:unnamed protein product [Phytophthora fragariaefolia]